MCLITVVDVTRCFTMETEMNCHYDNVDVSKFNHDSNLIQ